MFYLKRNKEVQLDLRRFEIFIFLSLLPSLPPGKMREEKLKENFTLTIFCLFHLNWPRIGFYNPIYKNVFFFSSIIRTFLHHLHKIYVAFYLLTWTYFNDVNGGRNILIISQLKKIIFISSDKKKWKKLRKTEKKRKKKIKTMEVTS